VSLDNIQVWKVLRLFAIAENARRAALRADARQTAAKLRGINSPAMDFYGPIWSDIKAHVYGGGHLPQLTAERIGSNASRKNIYEQIRDGFMPYWLRKRRALNGPIRTVRGSISGILRVGEASIRLENILSFDTASDLPLHLYPYLYCDPILTTQTTQLGLWELKEVIGVRAQGAVGIIEAVRSLEHLLPLSISDEQCATFFNTEFGRLRTEWQVYLNEYLARAA